MGERCDRVVDLAEDVGGLDILSERRAREFGRPRHPRIHVEDAVAGDEYAASRVQEGDVSRGVSWRVQHAQSSRDVEQLPVDELLGNRGRCEVAPWSSREHPARGG